MRVALAEFRDEFKSALEGDLSIKKMRELVKHSRTSAAQAGINIIGPECAVPLDVKVENLKTISELS